MKIIGGRAGGRQLYALPGRTLRPSSARVREAIFDMIGQDIYEAKVLDLFAGIGALGIEALSRGADYTAFVEKSSKAVEVIKKNLLLLNNAQVDVYKGTVEKILSTSLKNYKKFDIILLDPPYNMNLVPETIKKIIKYNIAASGARVYAEHFFKDEIPESITGTNYIKTKKYGDTKVTIFEII